MPKDEVNTGLFRKDSEEIAPSNEIRKWFSHDPEKWEEFMERYKKEFKGKTDLIGKSRG